MLHERLYNIFLLSPKEAFDTATLLDLSKCATRASLFQILRRLVRREIITRQYNGDTLQWIFNKPAALENARNENQQDALTALFYPATSLCAGAKLVKFTAVVTAPDRRNSDRVRSVASSMHPDVNAYSKGFINCSWGWSHNER